MYSVFVLQINTPEYEELSLSGVERSRTKHCTENPSAATPPELAPMLVPHKLNPCRSLL